MVGDNLPMTNDTNKLVHNQGIPAPDAAEDRAGQSHAKAQIARILRVDQAGEFGAQRIYRGQLDMMTDRNGRPRPGLGHTADLVKHMAEQEDAHLARFNEMVAQRGVRPTALRPIWTVAGYALGAVTALMGEKAAMACTAAVESVIDEHYAGQQATLERMAKSGVDEPELRDAIAQFRAEEAEHHDTAIDEGAEQAAAYPVLSAVIKTASRSAIWLSERI